jgi:hypothetical protein
MSTLPKHQPHQRRQLSSAQLLKCKGNVIHRMTATRGSALRAIASVAQPLLGESITKAMKMPRGNLNYASRAKSMHQHDRLMLELLLDA